MLTGVGKSLPEVDRNLALVLGTFGLTDGITVNNAGRLSLTCYSPGRYRTMLWRFKKSSVYLMSNCWLIPPCNVTGS